MMICHPSATDPSVTLCGAPIGLDWFEVALTDDYRRISCRTCRGWWNHENPDRPIPLREQPYVQRYSVTTVEGKLSDLSWEEALLYYRETRRSQYARHMKRPADLVAAYLMTGDRVIAALLIVAWEVVVDTAVGIGLEHLNRGDDS